VPTLVMHLPMAVRVQQDKIRECLPAAICTAAEAEGLDVTRMVTSLAGEHPWLRAGRWEVWLSHPSRTLLGGPAARPTPQHPRDVPGHFPEGWCTGPLPVIGGPPAKSRVAVVEHLPGPGLGLGFARGSHLTQEGVDSRR
jgi:hypothetical protein